MDPTPAPGSPLICDFVPVILDRSLPLSAFIPHQYQEDTNPAWQDRHLTPLLLCLFSGNACGSCSSPSPSASRSPGCTSGGKSTMTTMNSTGEWGLGPGHQCLGPGGSSLSLSPRLALEALSPVLPVALSKAHPTSLCPAHLQGFSEVGREGWSVGGWGTLYTSVWQE